MRNPNIRAEVIEANEFPQLARRYQVMAVPKTVVNDRVEIVGAVPEQQFVAELVKALPKKDDGEDQRAS